MRLSTVRPDDIVEVDKRGRVFLAKVTEREARELKIAPLDRGITYTTATAREVRAHWRKSRVVV